MAAKPDNPLGVQSIFGNAGGGAGVLLDFGGAAPGAAAAAPAPAPAPAAPAELKTINTMECMGPTGHYTQAMVVPPSASMVYVSGMLPVQTPMTGGQKVTGTIQEQTVATLANVKGALNGAGVGNLKTVVKVTVYITKPEDLAGVRPSLRSAAPLASPSAAELPRCSAVRRGVREVGWVGLQRRQIGGAGAIPAGRPPSAGGRGRRAGGLVS